MSRESGDVQFFGCQWHARRERPSVHGADDFNGQHCVQKTVARYLGWAYTGQRSLQMMRQSSE